MKQFFFIMFVVWLYSVFSTWYCYVWACSVWGSRCSIAYLSFVYVWRRACWLCLVPEKCVGVLIMNSWFM